MKDKQTLMAQAIQNEGEADAKQLMDDWRRGKGNTKEENFTTPGDRENPRNFTEDLAEAGEDNYPEAK